MIWLLLACLLIALPIAWAWTVYDYRHGRNWFGPRDGRLPWDRK